MITFSSSSLSLKTIVHPHTASPSLLCELTLSLLVAYAAAWILVALAGVLQETLKWVAFRADKHWKDTKKKDYEVHTDLFYVHALVSTCD